MLWRGIVLKILFIAPLSLTDFGLGGVLVKNWIIRDFLSKKDVVLETIDAAHWKTKRMITFWYFVKGFFSLWIKGSEAVILLSAADRGALTFLRAFQFLHLKTKVFYLVAGGKIPDEVKKRPLLLEILRQCQGIYVESREMERKMLAFGLDQTKWLPNPRVVSNWNYPERFLSGEAVRMCFVSRVCREKGVEIAIDIVEKLNKSSPGTKFCLDIYGPIQREYEDIFRNEVIGHDDVVYKGILDLSQREGYVTLGRYNLMLFPTFWEGEGYPGIVIESFIAGLPVYATDWAYNSELVVDGETGRLFPLDNLDICVQKILRDVESPGTLSHMRECCLRAAKEFDASRVFDVLLEDMMRCLSSELSHPRSAG